MTEVPSEIKYVVSLATRATELESDEPAICYWIRYWIVQKVMSQQQTRSPAVDEYLTKTLDLLEAMKSEYSGMREIEDRSEGRLKVEKFALSVFDNADREEKANRSSKSTAAKFLAAAIFLEVCQVFGDPEKTIVDKRKYSKAQAMRIQSAIVAGRDPNQRRMSSYPTEPAVTPFEDVSEAHRTDCGDDGTGSLTTGIDNVADCPMSEVPTLATTRADPQFLESTRLANSLGAASHVQHPIVPDITVPNYCTASSPKLDSEQIFDSAMQVELIADSLPVDLGSAKLLDVAQMADFTGTSQNKSGHNAHPSYQPTSEDIEASQKHAKWAISALNYEDVETAILELGKSLSLLGG